MDNLLDIDWSRWEIILLSLLPALVNIIIFIYVCFFLPQNRTNIAFSIFVLLLGLWQLDDGLTKMSNNAETAMRWYRMTDMFLMYLFPFGILFTLSISKLHKRFTNRFMFVTLFFPAMICSFFLFAGLSKFTIIKSEQWYWIANPEPGFINSVVYLFLCTGALYMLILLWRYYIKTKSDKIKRKQSFLLAAGFTIPVIGGILMEAVFPLILGLDVVPVTTSLLTIFTVTTLIAIKKYNMLSFSPKRQWDQIVENMNEGILIVNNNDEVMYANQMFCRFVGFKFEEIEGKLASELFIGGPENKKNIERTIEERKNKKLSQYEIQLKIKTGEKIWVSVSRTPYIDEDGKIIGSIGILNNINSLKKTESLFRTLIENNYDTIILTDQDGLPIYQSPSVEKTLGWTMAEKKLIGGLELIHPEDVDTLEAKIKEVLLNPCKPVYSTHRLKHKKGHYLWVKGTIRNMLNDSNINALVHNFRDVTKQKESDRNLRQSIKEISDYKYALDESSIVSVTDQKGILTYVNDNFCRISKYSREELIGQNHIITDAGYHSKKFRTNLLSTIKSGNVWRGEIKNKAKDGSFYWEDTTIVPFVNEAGQPYQYVSIRSDITDRKDFEENLKQSELRLKQAQAVAHVGSWALNFESGVAIWSDEACKIYGLRSDENKQTYDSWVSFIHPEDLSSVMKVIKNADALLSTSSFYHRIICVDGTIKFIYSESHFEFDDAGKPIGLFGIMHDVTEEKLAEEKMEFDRNNLSSLINNTRDLMWSVDSKFKLITSNHAFDTMVAQLAGSPIAQGSDVLASEFSEDQRTKYRTFYERALAGETFTEIEHLKFPEEYWSEISFYPIRNGKTIIGTACFSRNVTEQRSLIKETLDTVATLQSRNKDLRKFSFMVSHHLRAPVANILGIAALIKITPDQKINGKTLVECIETEVLNLDNVVREMNDIISVRSSDAKEVADFSKVE